MIYRKSRIQKNGFTTCKICIGESNLMISSDKPVKRTAKKLLAKIRNDIKNYIQIHPEFAQSFKPIKIKRGAPAIIKKMSKASNSADVGPMAAIAGAVAEELAKNLSKHASELIIENGGDIFVKVRRQIIVGIWCENEEIRNNLGISLNKKRGHYAVCTSSGTLGHSFNYGKADAATVIAKDAALADAWATRLGNEVKNAKDLKRALSLLVNIKGLIGGFLIYQKTIAVWGDINLTQITG